MRYILHERMAMNALAFIKDTGNEGVPPGNWELGLNRAEGAAE